MNNIGADAARLAGLQIDTLTKYRVGRVTLDQWERFNNLSPEAREERFGGDWKRPAPTTDLATPPLLLPFRTVQISGTSRFVPSEKIREGTDKEIGVKVVYVSAEVVALTKGVVEENVGPANLRIDRLSRTATCSEIDVALAGRYSCFSDLWELVKLQPKGEAGLLHVDGKANLIKIKVAGVVWLVNANFDHWDDERGWYFSACQAVSSDEWGEDRQVVSRDS